MVLILLSQYVRVRVCVSAGKIKAKDLRAKPKTELVKQLEELKKELSEVRKREREQEEGEEEGSVRCACGYG